MIDFSKYTLQELQAISDALDTLTNDIVERDLSLGWVFREYRNAREAVEKKIAKHVHEAEEKPIKVNSSSMYGTMGEVPVDPPAACDPPAPPDMFGWVGDALDDLCAAGEVIGNDR